ncbi:MAG: hypothetical protein CVU04_05875 [Bacteroidetes bacterium HGW-Bacteroidetes-20]|nr:MAG: hypothetical protein CVU04_05875 [Bacteroidetes bacterium HGW-Bacteroidetes-20]
MKKKSLYIILFVILGAFLFSSCQEKIYGQTKRRKKRNCGCELIKTPPKMDAYAYTENTK